VGKAGSGSCSGLDSGIIVVEYSSSSGVIPANLLSPFFIEILGNPEIYYNLN
jgi:hypothetical protein